MQEAKDPCVARELSAAIEQGREHDTNSVPQTSGNTCTLAGNNQGGTLTRQNMEIMEYSSVDFRILSGFLRK